MRFFKPTSIIFFIIALALIVAGIVLCIIGGTMAKNQNMQLFAEHVDTEGNSISLRSLGDLSLKSIKVNLNGATVKVFGDSSKNQVKLVNFGLNSFDYSITGGELVLKEAGIFSAFNFINDAGSNFFGLRHYLVMGRYKPQNKVVEIYLTSDMTNINDISIELNKGNVEISNLCLDCSCNIILEKGNVTVIKSVSDSKINGGYNISIKNGNVVFDENEIKKTNAVITESGNISCYISTQHSFTLKSANGMVFLDGRNIGKEYDGTYPEYPIMNKANDNPENSTNDDSGDNNVNNTIPVSDNDDQNEKIKNPMSFTGKTAAGDISVKIIVPN